MKSLASLTIAGLALGLAACATKTVEGPVTYSAPVSGPAHTQTTSTSKPTPAPTPDPLAPAPLQQKPTPLGTSPLLHGADQPLYQRTQ